MRDLRCSPLPSAAFRYSLLRSAAGCSGTSCSPRGCQSIGAGVPVAKFLMDQGKTAGIGNYLLSETLYKARVYPWASCGDLDPAAWAAVHAAAAETIGTSYAAQSARTAASPVGVGGPAGAPGAAAAKAAEEPGRRQAAQGAG